MDFSFRVARSDDGTWAWAVFVKGGTGSPLGFGAGLLSRRAAVDAIKAWYNGCHMFSIDVECLCGSRGIYAPFAPGHGSWCPVSEWAVADA